MRLALINGAASAVFTHEGGPFSVVGISAQGGRIVEIDILADPERLGRLDQRNEQAVTFAASPWSYR